MVDLDFNNPVMKDFAFYAVILIGKIVFMGLLTSAIRVVKGVFANSEDVVAFYKGNNPAKKVPTIDEDVERARRNHLNDLENIVPFLLLGFIYIISSPAPQAALWHFRIFAGAKLFHMLCYQFALQPWRALSHFVGMGVMASMGWNILNTVW